MSKKSKKKKAFSPWRWQLDVLLLLLTATIMLWIVANVQLIDMSRVLQAYLPPIEEPKGVVIAAQQKNQWLETQVEALNPVVQKTEPEEDVVVEDIQEEQQEATVIASVTEPKKPKETWTQVESEKPVNKPKPNYVTATENIDKKVALTPPDEIF